MFKIKNNIFLYGGVALLNIALGLIGYGLYSTGYNKGIDYTIEKVMKAQEEGKIEFTEIEK